MSQDVVKATPSFAGDIAWRKLLLRVLLGAGLVLVLWFAVTCVRIVKQGGRDEARKADAIVVFGAAEYSGRPSPVLRARLDHALALYKQGFAPVVITTGGAAWDPKYTEGGVGRDYLARLGVPDHALISETYAENTEETAERLAVILRTNGMKSCIAVSDPTHLYRIKQMLNAHDVAVYVSPRQKPAKTWYGDASVVAREAVAYMAWRLRP